MELGGIVEQLTLKLDDLIFCLWNWHLQWIGNEDALKRRCVFFSIKVKLKLQQK